MGKTGKISGFIALVLLIGWVSTGCASLSGSSSGSRKSSQAAGGKSASAQAAGGSSQVKAPNWLGKTGGKVYVQSVGFFKKNWPSLLIIVIICASCTYSCITVKRKVKKTLKKRIIIASIILVSAGLVYVVWHNNGKINNLSRSQISKSVATKSNQAKTAYAYVNTARLNLRAGSSPSHKIVKVLPRNTRVEIISSSGTWWKVRYEKTEGYVNSKYLRK